MAPRCSVCTHPARSLIDEQLRDRERTLQSICDWCAEKYPTDPAPLPAALSRHRINHTPPVALTSITLRDGELVTEDNSPLERVSVLDGLNAIITIGIRNALVNPHKVSTKDVIEAARLMKSIGMASGEFEEFFKAWGTTVKKKSGKKVIEIEPPEEVLEAWEDEEE